MQWMVPKYTTEMAEVFVENSSRGLKERKSLTYGIFRDGKFVGVIGFNRFDWTAKTTEIGYWIDAESEGVGIITRACRRLVDYAFGELALNRIEIRCSTENLRSSAVPLRLGFTHEGTLRQSEMRNGRLQDFAIFGLLAPEWDPTKSEKKGNRKSL